MGVEVREKIKDVGGLCSRVAQHLSSVDPRRLHRSPRAGIGGRAWLRVPWAKLPGARCALL